MPAFNQSFCASVPEIVWDLPTSLPNSAARGDREGAFGRNEQLACGNCGADRIYRSSRPYPDVCKRRWRDTGVRAPAGTPNLRESTVAIGGRIPIVRGQWLRLIGMG